MAEGVAEQAGGPPADAGKPSFQKTMQMGLGEAIHRLLQVELMRSRGLASVPAEAKAERDLIVEALNTHMLDLGFDCDMDGVPDTVQIFTQSAQTSCCRIIPTDTSRKQTGDSSRRATTSSRR